MVAIVEMSSIEAKFYADFKNLCKEAKGDLSVIVQKMQLNTETISTNEQREIERKIQGYTLNSKAHRCN